MLSTAALRAQIASRALGPLYVLAGPDDKEKTAIASLFGDVIEPELRAFNVERFYGTDAKPPGPDTRLRDIIEAARTLPMMADRRIVVLLQADQLLEPETPAARKTARSLAMSRRSSSTSTVRIRRRRWYSCSARRMRSSRAATGRIENPAHHHRRVAGIRHHPSRSPVSRSDNATAKSCRAVSSEYVLSTVQLTMPPVNAPTMMSASVCASWRLLDLAAGYPLLHQLEERGVQSEAALNAVAGTGQHLGDHLAVGVTGFDQHMGDVVEKPDQPLDRLPLERSTTTS